MFVKTCQHQLADHTYVEGTSVQRLPLCQDLDPVKSRLLCKIKGSTVGLEDCAWVIDDCQLIRVALCCGSWSVIPRRVGFIGGGKAYRFSWDMPILTIRGWDVGWRQDLNIGANH